MSLNLNFFMSCLVSTICVLPGMVLLVGSDTGMSKQDYTPGKSTFQEISPAASPLHILDGLIDTVNRFSDSLGPLGSEQGLPVIDVIIDIVNKNIDSALLPSHNYSNGHIMSV